MTRRLHWSSSSSRWWRLFRGRGVNPVIDRYVCTTEATVTMKLLVK